MRPKKSDGKKRMGWGIHTKTSEHSSDCKTIALRVRQRQPEMTQCTTAIWGPKARRSCGPSVSHCRLPELDFAGTSGNQHQSAFNRIAI
jgi:hypothetical protein